MSEEKVRLPDLPDHRCPVCGRDGMTYWDEFDDDDNLVEAGRLCDYCGFEEYHQRRGEPR